MKMKIFTIYLCCLLYMVSLAIMAQNNHPVSVEEYYYYSKGKKTALVPVTDEIFVTFTAKASLSKGNSFTTALRNQVQKLDKGDVFAPVNAVRYKVNAGLSGSYQRVEKQLKSKPDVITAYPAFMVGKDKVYVSNKIHFTLKKEADLAQIKAFLKKHKAAIVEEINLGDRIQYVAAVSKGGDVFNTANKLFESGQVEYAEPDFTFTGQSHYLPNDFFFPSQWFLEQASDADIDAPEAWNITTGAYSVTVAVIDGNGYDLAHPDMTGKYVNPYDAVNDDNVPSPENASANHGTPCAGLIGATTNNTTGVAGVGFNIKVMPVCIGFNAAGNSFSSNSTIIARAAAKVVAASGVVAVSNSYGLGSTLGASVEASYAAMRTNSRGGLGAVILASTMNDGLNNPTNIYPAVFTNVVGVGASTSSDTRASFSNYGNLVDIVAPGVNTITIDRSGAPGYASDDYYGFSGTSAACPIAAGVVGLMASVNPNANWATLMSYLLQSADKAGPYTYTPGNSYGSWNNEMGYGRANAFKALQKMVGPPVVYSFSPAGGPVGTSVTIKGAKFLGTTSVTFNNVPAQYTVVNATTITAISPAANSGPIRVTNFAGTGTGSTYTLSTYCAPLYEVACSSGDYINNFSLYTLVNNGSACNGQTANYINYDPIGTKTTVLLKGQSYPISMQGGPNLSQGFGVWIDYNNDSDFSDTGEFVYKSPSAGKGVFSGTITIPSTVTAGQKRMRVRTKYYAVPSADEWCAKFNVGETEDYTITIGYCIPQANCAFGDYINNFSFNTLVNNNTGCNTEVASVNGYINNPATGTLTTTVSKGKSYGLKVQAGSFPQGFGVWIDYNNDSDFNDSGEFVYASSAATTNSITTNITILSTASTGQRRLRVRCKFNATFTASESCTDITNGGETEDYTITINEGVVTSSQWNKRFGGSATDNFSVVIKTSDGGYLLGGHTQSGISGDKTQASQGNFDFWLVKTDAAGNKLWDKRYGGSGADYLNAAIQTSDGGYLLGGNSISGVSGDKTQASRGGRDYWVIKINSAGAKQWDKCFGGTGDEDLRTLIQTAAGYYFLAGYSNSAAGGDKSQGTQGNQDYWVIKLTTTGAKIFDKRFGGSGNDFLEGVAQTADGGYILGGHSQSGISGDKTQASRGASDYWLVRIDGAGAKVWDKRFGGTSDDVMTSIGRTAAGFFYAAGFSTSGAGGDKSQGSQGGKDYWMLKITPDGAKLWDKRFGGTADEELRSIIQTSDGGYLIGGKSLSGVSADKTQDSRGNSDYWAVKTDGNGIKQWDKRFGGSAADELRSVLQAADGSYLLGGRSDSGVGGDKTQGSQGGTDYWLVKVSAGGGATIASSEARVGAEIGETQGEQISLSANPNPFTEKLTVGFTLQKAGQIQLKVYDSQGTAVTSLFEGEAEAGKKYEVVWQVRGEKAGMYVIRLGTSNGVTHKKVILGK